MLRSLPRPRSQTRRVRIRGRYKEPSGPISQGFPGRIRWVRKNRWVISPKLGYCPNVGGLWPFHPARNLLKPYVHFFWTDACTGGLQ
jgi:hypothetical protein